VLWIILVLFAPDVQGQKSLAEIYAEAGRKGMEQAHQIYLQSQEHAHQRLLQYNSHLQEYLILEMELKEERRKSTLQSALAGFSGSQYLIAMMLLEEGGTANETDAARWLHRSAEQGFADSQTALGHLYQLGIGVPSDLPESAKWFQLAADQNHYEAKYHLGIAYQYSLGVAVDSLLSFELIQNAAENGYAEAQHYLGLAYLQGIGTEIDEKRGLEWVQNTPPEVCQIFESCIYLGIVYAQGGASFSANTNTEKALQYFSIARDQEMAGNVMMNLGEELAKDAQQTPEKMKALLWLYLADELGYSSAQIKPDSLARTVNSRERRAVIRNVKIYVDVLLSKTYEKNQ